DQIGEEAGKQFAAAALVAREPRGIDGRGLERLFEGEALLRMPAVALVERAQDAGADPGPGVEFFDRRVRTVGEESPGVPERAVGIRAVRLSGPEAVGEVSVRRGMAELDGGGDAELGEPGHVLRGEQLRMLDPRSKSERLPDGARLFEGIERLSVREVADGVHRDGEPCGGATANELRQLFLARDLNARGVEEPSRLRAERAVHEGLQV